MKKILILAVTVLMSSLSHAKVNTSVCEGIVIMDHGAEKAQIIITADDETNAVTIKSNDGKVIGSINSDGNEITGTTQDGDNVSISVEDLESSNSLDKKQYVNLEVKLENESPSRGTFSCQLLD